MTANLIMKMFLGFFLICNYCFDQRLAYSPQVHHSNPKRSLNSISSSMLENTSSFISKIEEHQLPSLRKLHVANSPKDQNATAILYLMAQFLILKNNESKSEKFLNKFYWNNDYGRLHETNLTNKKRKIVKRSAESFTTTAVSPTSAPLSAAAIIGICFGCAIVLALIFGLIFCDLARRGRRRISRLFNYGSHNNNAFQLQEDLSFMNSATENKSSDNAEQQGDDLNRPSDSGRQKIFSSITNNQSDTSSSLQENEYCSSSFQRGRPRIPPRPKHYFLYSSDSQPSHPPIPPPRDKPFSAASVTKQSSRPKLSTFYSADTKSISTQTPVFRLARKPVKRVKAEGISLASILSYSSAAPSSSSVRTNWQNEKRRVVKAVK